MNVPPDVQRMLAAHDKQSQVDALVNFYSKLTPLARDIVMAAMAVERGDGWRHVPMAWVERAEGV